MSSRLKPHIRAPAATRPQNSPPWSAAHRRDAILEAIAASAKELLRSSDLNASLERAVKCVGQAAGTDRLHIILLKSDAAAAGPGRAERGFVDHHYVWSAPHISTPPNFLEAGKSMAAVGLASWVPKLDRGETIVGQARNFEPCARKFLESGGVRSVLRVPIFVDGGWCGIIGFDDCRDEHVWLPTEIDIVKILAELIGAASISLRRVRVLADANRIVEASPIVVYRIGPQPPYPLTYISQNVRRYGFDAADLLAAPGRWYQYIDKDDLPAALANIALLVEGKIDHARLEYRMRTANGDNVWFNGEVTALRDGAGGLIALEGITTDITERRRAEEEIAASHVLLRAAVENSPDAILIVNQNARITTFNRHFAAMWEIPPDLIAAGDDAPVLNLVTSRMKNEAEFVARVRDFYAQPHADGSDELETKDGRTIERHSAPLYDQKERYLGRIWFFRDITERKTAERTIIELARTDALTALPNRVAFLDRLRLAFAYAKRGARPFAVLYLDLDHFKDVNDTLGHPAGDTLLKVVASRLQNCVRATDMVARFGGDEFAVLQENAGEIAGIEALAGKICKAVADPVLIDGNQTYSSASIGIVPYSDDVADPEAMMTKADLALFRAKTEGRDRFRFHIRELDEKVRERVAIGEGLHSAIENEELELYYQPQVELVSTRLVGLEALLRWNHPTRGRLLPAQFIPIAESSGTILQIGQWVIERVCRQIAAWQRQGVAPHVVAANISAGQFKLASNLDSIVAAALAEHGVAPDRLELELTESVLMEATQRHSEEFERLRRVGVRLAIDDFGTGYSSLDYLRSFRVARLKIDRSFVDEVATNADDATIVRAVVGLARALGVEVVAEGVETAEQRAFLISAGCRFAQGYYFGRPLPVAAATALLRKECAAAG